MRSEDKAFNPTTFHDLQPDYTRPLLEIPENYKKSIKRKLRFLYNNNYNEDIYRELERIMKVYYAHKTETMREWEKDVKPSERFTEKDVILITYGDLIRSDNDKPLKTLGELGKKYLNGVFNTLHILPFFPYSSDRGFAVMDFEEVDPNLGSWEDIMDLKSDFKLMFDGVFNHVSSKSRWFQEFLNQNLEYRDFFTVFSTREKISADHLKLIVRPRTSDILSSFHTLNGLRLVWTTFSSDQIDLNYKNYKVLLKMVDILLTYVRRGADVIRLDAVTYLWEELGTSCIHLDQSHVTIKLFRDILDVVAPHVVLITETNVPHADNIKYFGNGRDEAQMVYNFALPPLVLHAFQTGNATKLTEWAASLERFSDQTTYFNFLDSHDGIGVMAVKNILTAEEIEVMALKVLEHGGYISYKAEGDGTQSPYEFNITWFSAINNEDAGEPRELQVSRYVASRAIALVLMGVPGVYIHGLLGSKNDAELVIEERQTRSINRKNINKEELLRSLESPQSTTFLVTVKLIRLIQKRIHEKAFHPNAGQQILNLSESLFCVLRTAVDNSERILSIINITAFPQKILLDMNKIDIDDSAFIDLVSQKKYQVDDGKINMQLNPYQIVWLKNIS